MMGKRKLPFGYKLELGKIVVHEEEAPAVTEIFRYYILGESLKQVAEIMAESGVIYDEGKSWNKNTVSRILSDERYIGEKDYPPIIADEQFRKANEKKVSKPNPTKKTEAQKVLRRLCAHTVSERIEQETAELLRKLTRCPEIIQNPAETKTEVMTAVQTELDNALDQQPVDEEKTKKLILQLAAERYDRIGSEEYETIRLRRLFSAAEEQISIDVELLKGSVSKVFLREQKICLQLKNGQIVGGEDLK